MVAVTASADRRFDMGRVVQRTFAVLGRNLGVFAAWALVLSAGPYLLLNWGVQLMSSDAGEGFGMLVGVVGWAVTMIGAYLLQAAVVHATVADLNGKRVSFGDGISTGKSHILSLFGLAILMGLALGLGLVLLVVPALVMATMWAVAAPALVVERLGVSESLGRSRSLTKGSRWPVFGLVFVYFVLAYGLYIGLMASDLVITDAAQVATPLQLLISAVFTGVSSLLSAAGAAALYYELRSAKEGVGGETLASVFD